jgi:hypothetical protein
MGQDPWCVYEPGTYGGVPIAADKAVAYGRAQAETLVWTPEAHQLVQVIPAFVRGRVIEAVERYARAQHQAVITVEVMRQARAASKAPLPFLLKREVHSDQG